MLDLKMERYFGKGSEDVLVCFNDLVHFSVSCRGTMCRGGRCGRGLSFPFWTNHQEDEFVGLGDHLLALLSCDERDRGSGNYLWYPVALFSQSNNDTTRPRFIHNMTFPHIWLS